MTIWQVAVFWLSAAVVWLAGRNLWLRLQLSALQSEYIRALYRGSAVAATPPPTREDAVLDSEVIE